MTSFTRKVQSKNVVYRAFNINFPKQLFPVYHFLQNELNRILNNDYYYNHLNNINVFNENGKRKLKGHIWNEIEHLLNHKVFKEEKIFNEQTNEFEIKKTLVSENKFTKHWDLGCNAWYFRILIENIARSLFSLQSKRDIHNILCKHHMTISSELREDLKKANLYPTNKELNNLIRYNKRPDLSKTISLELDYSISDKTIFNKISPYHYKIRLSKDKWFDYYISLPNSLRLEANGNIANPNFICRQRDNKYIGICSYEVEKQNIELAKKVLGVDLGFIKLFSAVIVDEESNEVSHEYTNSESLQNHYGKIARTYTSLSNLKQKLVNSQKVNKVKDLRRVTELIHTRNKIQQSKQTLMKELAYEVVSLAKHHHCYLIKVEDLGVMSHITGKWNYGEFHKALINLAEIFNIKVEKVNPKNTSKTHPITKEIGKVVNRHVVFDNNDTVDRDFLASINIAIRGKKSIKINSFNNQSNIETWKRALSLKKPNKIEKLIACLLTFLGLPKSFVTPFVLLLWTLFFTLVIMKQTVRFYPEPSLIFTYVCNDGNGHNLVIRGVDLEIQTTPYPVYV